MRATIEIGDYGGPNLEEWIQEVDSKMSILTYRVERLEETIKRIKQIVPLVDDELGMHSFEVESK